MAKDVSGHTVDAETRERVRERVARDGVSAAAKFFDLDKSSVLRVCAGFPVRRGTGAQITLTLAHREDRI